MTQAECTAQNNGFVLGMLNKGLVKILGSSGAGGEIIGRLERLPSTEKKLELVVAATEARTLERLPGRTKEFASVVNTAIVCVCETEGEV